MENIEIGTIIFIRDDNGIIEITKADDYAYINNEALCRNENMYVRDGPFIAFKGKTTEVWYEFIEEDFIADRWIAKLIRKKGL